MPLKGRETVVATLCVILMLTTRTQQQKTINIIVLTSGGDNQCAPAEELERAQNETDQTVIKLLSEYISETYPVYECNGTTGWRQLAFINMSDSSYNCPPGLQLSSHSTGRTCGRAPSNTASCSSTTFSAEGTEYSQVCGRIKGYQFGGPGAFVGYVKYSQGIDSWYVSGISLTHGQPGARQHIWTFANAYSDSDIDKNYHDLELYQCPCDNDNPLVVSPPFVGSDYFCESGTSRSWTSPYPGVFFPDDPLWNGRGCSSTSTCCQFNNPPWFAKELPNPTTDDIELRLCAEETLAHDDTRLELIELYIK